MIDRVAVCRCWVLAPQLRKRNQRLPMLLYRSTVRFRQSTGFTDEELPVTCEESMPACEQLRAKSLRSIVLRLRLTQDRRCFNGR